MFRGKKRILVLHFFPLKISISNKSNIFFSGTSNIQVLVGTNDLQSGGTRYKPERFIVHESYNRPNTYQNDIALIKMEKMQFNENVQPIKYSENFVKDGTQLQTTGCKS